MKPREPHIFEKVTTWIGSPSSFLIHTVIFFASFLLSTLGIIPWAIMLLTLTTIVSLEAIYLSIFIQMTVNRHSHELAEVSEDIGDIQEDVQDMSEDVEDIQENIEDISEEKEHEDRLRQHALTLDNMTKDIQHLLSDLEKLKREGQP